MEEKLISGDFSPSNLPKSEQYLFKYFKNDQQQQFVVYYTEFCSIYNASPKRFYQSFIDHTGFHCGRRIIQLWIVRLKKLRALMEKAIKEYDFEMIELLNSGNIKPEQY